MIVDTNILVRCIRGRAAERVSRLLAGNVSLMVAHHNVAECISVLMRVFGLDGATAFSETMELLEPFEIVDSDQYEDLRDSADRRLRSGGKSDWPVLATAMVLDGDIWSEDVDFFGTGVAVWSSHNVLECTNDKGSAR